MTVDDKYTVYLAGLREELIKLEQTFNFLTDEKEFEKNTADRANQSIHPLYVGEGSNRRLRGVRLGKEIPAASGSICLEAMIHMNEPAGLAGLQAALDWWNGLKKDEKDKVSGDVYLMFAGEHQQARKFFDRTIRQADTISIDELTSFRKTSDGKTNRNRIPAEAPTKNTDANSEKELWEDYQWMKKQVYNKCAAAKAGDKPGLIIGLHTTSQPTQALFIPNFYPFPQNMDSDESRRAIVKTKKYIAELCAVMGAEIVSIENHYDRGENFFEGVSATSPKGDFIPPGTIIRGTFEAGQHLNPASSGIFKNAVLNALEYKFGIELVRGVKRPAETHAMTFGYNTRQWFAPDSINKGMNPKRNREWLVPPINASESYDTIHLITGNELAGAERNEMAKKPDWTVKPKGLGHINNEVWDVIVNPRESTNPTRPAQPETVWEALNQAAPDQLANGAEIKEGQCFAYIDIMQGGKIVRQELLYAPHNGVCSMFPMDPNFPSDQKEDIATIYQRDKHPTIVQFPVGRPAIIKFPPAAGMQEALHEKDMRRLKSGEAGRG